MPQVQLPESFFKKERDTIYSNWHLELFRELFQNSLDAGSTKIVVDIENDTEESMAKVSFKDNGCGMNRRVLEEVYFRLGETTKTGSQVGGFGRARILTNFSMDKYEIHTRNLKVEGKGASYEIFNTDEIVGGCDQYLWTSDAQTWDLRQGFLDFVSRCHFKIPIVFNGQEMSSPEFLNVENNFVRTVKNEDDLVIGSVFYLEPTKAPVRGVAVIRVNGSFMFEAYVGCEGLVVVELEPLFSRVMLNASRNSFQSGYDHKFQEIFAHFAQNEKTASERTYVNELHTFKGSGVFYTTSENSKNRTTTRPKGIFKAQMAHVVKDFHQALVENTEPKYTSPSRAKDIRLEGNPEQGFVSYVGDWIQDTYVRVSTADEDLKRLSRSWDPSIWRFVVKGNDVSFGEYKDKLNLLNVWKEAIFCAIEALIKENPKTEIAWSPGFLITSNRTAAQHESVDGHHRLFLNPYNSDKAVRFSLTSEESLMEILATAKHEVAHTMFQNHGENYSIVHTGIDMRLNQREALIRMKNVRV